MTIKGTNLRENVEWCHYATHMTYALTSYPTMPELVHVIRYQRLNTPTLFRQVFTLGTRKMIHFFSNGWIKRALGAVQRPREIQAQKGNLVTCDTMYLIIQTWLHFQIFLNHWLSLINIYKAFYINPKIHQHPCRDNYIPDNKVYDLDAPCWPHEPCYQGW